MKPIGRVWNVARQAGGMAAAGVLLAIGVDVVWRVAVETVGLVASWAGLP